MANNLFADRLFLTAEINALTAGSATSASSNARRTSRKASAMLSSVRRASPRSVFMTRASRWVRLSRHLISGWV